MQEMVPIDVCMSNGISESVTLAQAGGPENADKKAGFPLLRE